MRIARIIYDWPPPWGGLAPHPYELTVAQTEQGHSVDVFCGRWPKAGDVEKPTGTTIHTIWREPLPGTAVYTSSILLFFKYLSWRKSNKIDILHAHGHFGIWIFYYRLVLKRFFPWAKELKIPLVVHFHNVAKARWKKLKEEGKISSPLVEIFLYPMEVYANKLAIKSSAANIFVSEKNKQEAIEHYKADPEKCFVLESGINADRFYPIGEEEKEKSRRDLGLDMFDKVIINHGMLVRRKNIHLLVEALALLPENYKLLLSGPIDSAYVGEIDEVIKRRKIDSRVLKTGYVPYPEAPIAYQISDVFVLPSSWEGMPKAPLESLACGVPVLASAFKFPEEVAGLAYLENLEPQYIANKVQEVVEGRVEVDYSKVISKYSWMNRAEELDKIYEYAKKHYI